MHNETTNREMTMHNARTRLVTALVAVSVLAACAERVAGPPADTRSPVLHLSSVDHPGTVVNEALGWNQTALAAVSAGTLGPPMVARALAIVHTAMFDGDLVGRQMGRAVGALAWAKARDYIEGRIPAR